MAVKNPEMSNIQMFERFLEVAKENSTVTALLCIVKKRNEIEVCDLTENVQQKLHAEEVFCENTLLRKKLQTLTADRVITLYINRSPCSNTDHSCAKKLKNFWGPFQATVSIKFVDQYYIDDVQNQAGLCSLENALGGQPNLAVMQVADWQTLYENFGYTGPVFNYIKDKVPEDRRKEMFGDAQRKKTSHGLP